MYYLLDYEVNRGVVIADSTDTSIELLDWGSFELAVQKNISIRGVDVSMHNNNRSVRLARQNLPLISGRDTTEYYARLGYPIFVIDKILCDSRGVFSFGRLIKFSNVDYKDFISDKTLKFCTNNGSLLSNKEALDSGVSLITNCIPAFSICNKSIYLISGAESAMKISTMVSDKNKVLLISPKRGTNWSTPFSATDNFLSVVQHVWRMGVFDFA